VRDAGVTVDELRGAVRVLGVDLRGHQHRLVPQRPRVEDRCDLADDALVEEALDPPHDLLLTHLGALRDVQERPARHREVTLHEVEQLLVQLVQRDGGAVLAGAQLGNGYASHRATSLAW
jgi:hypothetical protein